MYLKVRVVATNTSTLLALGIGRSPSTNKRLLPAFGLAQNCRGAEKKFTKFDVSNALSARKSIFKQREIERNFRKFSASHSAKLKRQLLIGA